MCADTATKMKAHARWIARGKVEVDMLLRGDPGEGYMTA